MSILYIIGLSSVYFLIIFFIYIITVWFLSVVVGIKWIWIVCYMQLIGLPKLCSNFFFYYYLLYTLLLLYFTTRSRMENIVPSLCYLASTLNLSLLHQKLLIFPLLCWNFLFLINSDTSRCIYFFFNYIFIHEKVKNNRFTVGINIYKGTDNRILIDVKRLENRHGILV